MVLQAADTRGPARGLDDDSLPSTQPSLGTLIRVGQAYLFSGEWWMILFPSLALAGLALAVNLLGDWLRDALNPKLR